MMTNLALPYVDLHLAPYSVVADDATEAVATANTAAVKQALTDYAAIPAEFRFPPGRIYLDKDTEASNRASIALNGLIHTAPKTFRGSGRDVTTLQFQGAGNGGDWCGVKAFNGFRGFTICDMSLRFGIVAHPDPGGQMHLLEAVNSTAAVQSTRDFVAYNLGFGQCIGAGFRVLGENGANFLVENVYLHHCVFRSEGIGAGARSCLEVQRGFSNVEVSHCYMRGAKNTVIDCEETTVATEEGLSIHHNWLDHSLGRTKTAVSLGGSGAASLATRCRFTDNYVTGGSVACLSGDKWEISRNFMRVNGTNAGGSDWLETPVLQLFQTNSDLIIADNVIERSGVNTGNVVYFEAGPTTPQSHIVFKNNELIQAVAGNILQIESCDHLIIDGNSLRNTSASAGAFLAINVRALTRSCPGLNVVNNALTSTVRMLAFLGVSAGGTDRGAMTVSDVSVVNNNAGNACTRGVHFDVPTADGSTVDDYPVLQGNNFRGATNPWVASNHAAGRVFPIVWGNRGDVCQMVGTVAPGGAVTAVQGCRYTWQHGDSAQDFYKSSGTGNAGWSKPLLVP
jgi:hypothetical protein